MRTIKPILFSVALLGLTLVYNQCSQVSFDTASSSVGAAGDVTPPPGRPPPPGQNIYEADVAVQVSQSKPLDLVWVVDNSGSMTAEAAHVRSNFQSFVTTLGVIPDVRMAVISSIGTSGNSVSLPAGITIPSLEINQHVASRDGLQHLTSALCPKTAPSGSLCANFSLSTAIRGKLNSFFRTDSQKVLVMVTDDESNMTGASFQSYFQSIYPGQSMIIYGFIGLGKTLSPCQANTGTVYQGLSSSTGGAIFNVCDTDWSATFSQLANHVVTNAIETNPLPANILNSTIISVAVNGVTLTAAQYTLNATGIVIDPALRAGQTMLHLKIVYM